MKRKKQPYFLFLEIMNSNRDFGQDAHSISDGDFECDSSFLLSLFLSNFTFFHLLNYVIFICIKPITYLFKLNHSILIETKKKKLI